MSLIPILITLVAFALVAIMVLQSAFTAADAPKPARNTRNRGFTMIELLIVVAIIGILAAVIVPLFAGNSETEQAKALSDMKQYAQRLYPEATIIATCTKHRTARYARCSASVSDSGKSTLVEAECDVGMSSNGCGPVRHR